MKRNRSLFFIILGFVLVLGGAYILYTILGRTGAPGQLAGVASAPPQETAQGAEDTPAPEKVLAPDFTAYTLAGEAVRLSDYRGKPVVLNFWASWCGPCRSEMPDFNGAFQELGGEVHFLMVNMTSGRETLESASAFIQEQDWSFPVLYDTAQDAAKAYSVYSLPTTFFIDAEGCGVARAVGALDRETLYRGISMILPQ